MPPLQFLKRVICVLAVSANLCALDALPPGYVWHSISDIVDNTHRHVIYELRYEGRRVVDAYKKEHFSERGELEFQQSSLDSFRSVSLPRDSSQNYWEGMYGRTLDYEVGPYESRVKSEAVVWIHPQTKEPIAAIQLLMNYPNSLIPRKIIIEESSGRLLEEKNVVRTVSVSGEVFPINPTQATAQTVTIDYLDSAAALKSANVWVRREEVTTLSPLSVARKEVDPDRDYTAVSAGGGQLYAYTYPNADASSYAGAASCKVANSVYCPDQSIASVNVYYHLMAFRKHLDSYFTTLGSSVSFSADPLNAIINPISLVGTSSANNAMYVDSECESGMPACLLFLRPAALSSSSAQANCGTSSATLYDFAREAVVVAHEYQHYVTDVITHIAFNASGSVSVGDALHEGYSDYLAASYLSHANSPTNVTLVGAYSLSNCTALQRELSTLRVFTGGAAEADPHVSGLSWASGLWKLRTQIGREKADLIALKSLFFLSTNPGFVESIEALVRADQAIYSGANIATIRDIFYNQVKWGGNLTSTFKDPANGIVELGVKGCGGVHAQSENPQSLWITVILTLAFIFVTIRLGRKARRQ